MSVQYAATSQNGENDNFWLKIFDIFLIFAQNIDCWYTIEPPQRGGSNKYPQSMFCSENKKKYVYLCKPQFYYIKVGCKGIFISRTCFHDEIRFKILFFNFHAVIKKVESPSSQNFGNIKYFETIN